MKIDKPTAIILSLAAVFLIIGFTLNSKPAKTVDNSAYIRQQEKVSRAHEAYTTASVIERETETLEVAPVQQKYAPVNLSKEYQDWLIDYCYERHISPYMVMTIIENESQCNVNAVGDNGNSLGLMQIQPRWHKERMDKLGITNLMDAKQNVIAGVDILLELFNENESLDWVLMAYNGGTVYADRMVSEERISDYAATIMYRAYGMETE